MAHECACHTNAAATAGGAKALITPNMTVGDVAQRYTGAPAVMKDLGINHCCGAHLTLREAAASAGVALDALMAALNRPAAAKV